MKRIIATVVIFFAVVFLPYWVYLPLLFLGMIAFSFYWEAIPFAFLIEVLYGPSTVGFFSPVVGMALILTIVLVPLKEKMRFNL